MESLTTIPRDSPVFVDSNIFVYHFCYAPDQGLSTRTTEFFLRSIRDGLRLFTSTSVLAEVLHRALLYEATAKFDVDPKTTLNKIQKNPALTKDLTEYHTIPQSIVEFGVNVLSITMETIVASERWRRAYGLFVNDSLIAALMQQHAFKYLATNDSDFDLITEFVVCKPSL